MRRLLILRHAKSDWPAGIADADRALAPRGVAAATAMGKYLAAQGLLPELALVSPSRRTRETWALVAGELGGGTPDEIREAIYSATAETLLTIVRAIPDPVRTAILVGHNPGCEVLAAMLTGYGDRYAAARMMQKYPSAGLAVLDFMEGGWADVAPRAGRLDRFVTPGSIGAGADA